MTSQLFATDIYLYQEPLGSPSPYPAAVATWQYVGVRFQVDQPVQITAVDSVMGDSPSSFFAALVSLPSVSSLPQGNPFADGEVIYSTVFNLSWDFLAPRDIPFNVTVNPGAYAIIFGAGQFGSSGYISGVISTYSTVPDSTGFAWVPGTTPAWHDTGDTFDVSIHGIVVPEPSFIMLIESGVFILAINRKCGFKREDRVVQQDGAGNPYEHRSQALEIEGGLESQVRGA